MRGEPLVSVVIPAYNAADTIGEAIDSALGQTYPHVEVIVVDDGSTDDTASRTKVLDDPRLRLVQQAQAGPAAARNRGIREARGDFVQFCDADDRLLPEKIARCLPPLLARPDAALVYSRFRHVAADGVTPLPLPDSELLRSEGDFCEILHSNGSPIQTSTVLARKSALLQAGLYRETEQRCAEDWDLLLRLAADWAMIGVDEVLVYYRHRPDALTRQPVEMAEGRLRTVQYARAYPPRAACLDDAAFDALEAGRYHRLAMVRWEHGDRRGARDALRHALRLTPQGAAMRRLLLLMTYALPAHIADRVARLRG